MALKDWIIAYEDVELSPTYKNKKTREYIAIGRKQLGSFDNFKVEKFPFLRSKSLGGTEYVQWFSTKEQAFQFLKEYMRKN
jgi:hypothetical protein